MHPESRRHEPRYMEAAGAATRSHKLNDLQYTGPASRQAVSTYQTWPTRSGDCRPEYVRNGLGVEKNRQPADTGVRDGTGGWPGA